MSRTKAVRVACSGEIVKFVKDYQEYDIPTTHDVFTYGEVSEMSRTLGIPLLVVKVRPSLVRSRKVDKKTYGYGEDGDYYPNEPAMLLMSANGTMAQWSDKVGNVIIARQDKKPLHAAHLTVLMGFLHAAYQCGPEMSAEEKQAVFTPGTFKTYYESVVKSAEAENNKHELVTLPSPFELGNVEMVDEGVVL